MQCVDQANDPRASGEEREQLMKMREGLLALADNQDWLNGKVSGVAGASANIVRLNLGQPRQV